MKNPFANLFKKKSKDGEPDKPVPKPDAGKKKEGFFSKLLKNRLGKSSIKGEEILGVELTTSEIRLAQVSSNKANQWVLDKFYVLLEDYEGEPKPKKNNEFIKEFNRALEDDFNTPKAIKLTQRYVQDIDSNKQLRTEILENVIFHNYCLRPQV